MRISLCQIQPLMRSRAQQLRHQVNLFLCSSANDLENRWLPNDLIIIRNQGLDHRGHVGHQEGVGAPRKHAQQGGGPSQFGVQETDFESNSESRNTLPSNCHTGRVRPLIWVIFIYMKIKEIIFPMPLFPWTSKIRVGRNR
jgi:hypothetical protein